MHRPRSPCHDERVIYEIAADKKRLERMAIKSCVASACSRELCAANSRPPSKTLTCTSRGKDSDDWECTLSGDTLEGTLTINGQTRYRKIVTKKVTASSR